MPLEKLHHFLGYNNLALMMEQERKHYMLKVDKKKQYQDSVTGSVFNGTIDNYGTEIIVETNKTGIVTGSNMIHYSTNDVEEIFSIQASSFTYNNSLNGLMNVIVKSTKYPYMTNHIEYKNYKVKFINCTEVNIPFGSSLDNDEVYNTRWIKTTSAPVLILPDDSNVFNIEIDLSFRTDITGGVFYYPLNENLQPFGVTKNGTTYTLDAVDDDAYIGYPIYWFTCDNTNVGPIVSIENNESTVDNIQLLYVSNPGNVSSKYHTQIFCDIDGNTDATPTGEATSSFVIRCSTISGNFTNTDYDSSIHIDPSSIKFVNINDDEEYPIEFILHDRDYITLAGLDKWNRTNNTAEVEMSLYDTNCESLELGMQLIPMLNYHLDESIPFNIDSTDVGYAGLHFSSTPYSNNAERYPYDLNQWDGIPEWLNNIENGVPQHGCIYAIHNTPTYTQSLPSSRQVAALLFDPGKPKTSPDEIFTNDEIGRIYYLSNDDIQYHNNAIAVDKKPERTLARICDIPTSLVSLTDISGLSPTYVVDTDYVRTEVSYKTTDKDKLYNTLTSRWVRPSALDTTGHKISERTIQNGNEFVFLSPYLLDDVDLETLNDFRRYVNLNPSVDPYDVEIDQIYERGDNYTVGDMGVCIVGGFAFNYTVTSIIEDAEHGPVSTFTISPSSERHINISNFDIVDDSDGITQPYGTSPLTPTGGTGLRFSFKINNYSDLKTKRGGIFDDLFAIVKTQEGLFLYVYQINNNKEDEVVLGHWIRKERLADMEDSSTNKTNSGLSVSESYMNSIIPSMKQLTIAYAQNNQPLTSVSTFATPTFVNIVDTNAIPVTPPTQSDDERKRVDMTKLYCNNLQIGSALYHSWEYVLQSLKTDNRLRYDTYLLWRWVDPSDDTNTNFEYTIINRSFNNYVSNDSITTLPKNSLVCDNYVHTNESCSIVWNVDGIGNMLWVYNPSYRFEEKYYIDDATTDLTIERHTMTWRDIDIMMNSPFSIVDENGNMAFNICTDNPIQSSLSGTPNPIYERPDFTMIVEQGEKFDTLKDKQQPIGNWQLVFPRVNNYHLSNVTNNVTFDAIKMDIIRGSDLNTIGNVTNSEGRIVNKKVMVIDQTYDGNKIKVWNSQTNSWDIL